MKEKLCYGAGGFGIQILTNTISSYYMLFLTNVMNISPLAAGQLFFRIKLIDAFTDIICASLADKVQTKYGSYRPFLMLCSFPASVFFCLNFWAPAFEAQQIRLAWAYVIYFFTSTVFATLNNVPYTALNSVMSHDRNDQSAFASARTVGENVASIIISAVYKIILAFGTVNSPAGWRVMAVCFAILAFAALQFCAHGVQERYAAADSGGETARSTLRNLLQLRHNTPLIWVTHRGHGDRHIFRIDEQLFRDLFQLLLHLLPPARGVDGRSFHGRSAAYHAGCGCHAPAGEAP